MALFYGVKLELQKSDAMDVDDVIAVSKISGKAAEQAWVMGTHKRSVCWNFDSVCGLEITRPRNTWWPVPREVLLTEEAFAFTSV